MLGAMEQHRGVAIGVHHGNWLNFRKGAVMERLTESNPSWIDDELWERACEPDCEEIDAVYRKLKEYEDLEEQGRLVQLPCKVGDTVYHVVQGRIVEVSNVDLFFLLLSVAENRFNNSVFLTKSEAEAKLKELRCGND